MVFELEMYLTKKIKICGYVFLGIGLICLLPQESWGLQDNDKKAKSLASYTMGVVYDLQGVTEKAIEEFEKAAEYIDNYAVHLRLGADYARMGRLEDAITELQRVLDFDSTNIQARYLLALIYSSQKKFDEAAQEYESILTSFSKAEPENIEIYGYLGQLYYSQREYDKAIKQFEIILSLDKSNVDIMFLLGSLYLEVNKQEEAIKLFSKVIIIEPENDTCLNSLGYVYAEKGTNLDEAQDLIERALKVDPQNGAYLDSLGWIYFKKQQYDKALEYLTEADNYLKDPVISDHIGDVYFQIDEKEKARKYWSQSLELFPDQDHIKKKLNTIQ